MKYEIGQKVNARICNSVKLGLGVITGLENNLYRVQTLDGNFPLYEEEISPVYEDEAPNAQMPV